MKIIKTIENEEWYQELIGDCQAIIVESVFTSRWALVEGYHLLGKRILAEESKFTKGGYLKMSSRVATSLGKSQHTIERAIQFVKKYPELDTVPEGKNISWHKICNKYLPQPKEEIILPEGKYDVFYADPPYPYPERLDAKNLYGGASYHYDRMPIKELCNMKVKEISADNSVLFIWVATNFLEQSFEIIKSWGFKYKSQMVWVKKGGSRIGYYVGGDHELLLIATRGSYLPKTDKLLSSVVEQPRGKHSKKPEVFYDIIEQLYPNSKYIELFARNKRNNWESWGNEI